MQVGNEGCRLSIYNYEVANMAQKEPKNIFPLPFAMDEHKYSSAKIASYFYEFINLKIISKSSTKLKDRVLSRHKLLERVFENLKVGTPGKLKTLIYFGSM